MEIILKNPYRTVGLLVGATAKEQDRQIRRLKQFIEADQAPEEDFSFPVLGDVYRSTAAVTDAASKLNLDGDKINVALFWFYKGNSITDEPAFDELKNGCLKGAVGIWGRLVLDKDITRRNASAFFNWSTLFLNSAFHNTNETHLEKGIKLKLKFLESEFIEDFRALATDETYKTTKIKLQLLFLNQVQTEI